MLPMDIDLLRHYPLPELDHQADKEQRGRVLLIGGSAEIPGSLLLAATAAMRAGAGKLTLATAARVAPSLALAMPEARVLALDEGADGGFAASAADAVAELASRMHAIVLGPGMQGGEQTHEFVRRVLQSSAPVPLVADAQAMDAVVGSGRPQVLLTPHAGEMAHLTGQDKIQLLDQAGHAAQHYARQWQVHVLLKGAHTWLAAPDGPVLHHAGGNAGLAMSGSGDVLSGLIGGLLARRLSLPAAVAWGVMAHARAGEQLLQQLGGPAFLARELADAIPYALTQLQHEAGYRPSANGAGELRHNRCPPG